jgi:hypothetical protein
MFPTHNGMQIAKVDEVAFSWHRDTVQAGDEQVALVEDGMRKKRRPDRMLALDDPECA